jgi:predicted DCC family thiol-disulfide oxidoreductase YuxK
MPDAEAARVPEHLVLYDGACGFCSRTIQWIVDADRRRLFHFAPLQGPTAAALRARHPDLPTDLDSVIYVDRSGGEERMFVRADAAFRIAERLGGLPVWLRWTSHLPRWLADLGYRAVARVRRWLSRALAPCPLPPPTARARFLP